jgi:hypothetical protein
MAGDEKKDTPEAVATKAEPLKKKPPKHKRAAAKKRWGEAPVT